MYKNVISTQDLLSDSQRSNYSTESALFTLSQMQHSQSDFSQVKTQDMFTQNPSGSQNENSLSSGKKISMYEKWMSKGSLYKGDQTKHNTLLAAGSSNQQISRMDLTFQQQCQLNQAKAKERDEKDLLQQVVNTVQECSKEVKTTLSAVKDKLISHAELAGDKINDTLKNFLEDICKHEDRMLQAVEDKRHNLEKLHQLEKILALKEMEIKQLQNQVQGHSSLDDAKRVAKAVRQEMLSPHMSVENKLQEILDVTRETSEQQIKQLDQYKHQITNQSKHYSDWKTTSHKLIKDTEKRLLKELTNIGKVLQEHELQWQASLQEQMAQANSIQTQDIEKLVNKLLIAGNLQKEVNTTKLIESALKKDIQALLTKQATMMETSMQNLLHHELLSQQQQLQSLQTTLLADMSECIQTSMKNVQDEAVTPLSLPQFEEKFEEYHSGLKKQLEELHDKHVQEVLRLQKEMKVWNQPPATSSASCLPFASSAHPCPVKLNTCFPVSKSAGCQLQQKKGMAKVSPMSKLARASLFSKPSPVATVLPQQQTTEATAISSGLLFTDLDTTASAPFENKLPTETVSKVEKKSPGDPLQQKMVRGGRRKNRKFTGKRKPGGSVFLQNSAQKPSLQLPKETRKDPAANISIFSFSENEEGTVHNSPQLSHNSLNRSELCSPSQVSCSSHMSSPAMSITELVVVHRRRWPSRVPVGQMCHKGNHGNDILRTSFLDAIPSRTLLQDSLDSMMDVYDCSITSLAFDPVPQ